MKTTTTPTRATKYLIYRHGSNGSNQSIDVRPVAIVEASSRREAIACERTGDTVHDCAVLSLAPAVKAWANQTFSAVPFSRAKACDVRAVAEQAVAS